VAERFADGDATPEELTAANRTAIEFSTAELRWDVYVIIQQATLRQAYADWPMVDAEVVSLLIRDVFGNPFRPVTLDPAWQSATQPGAGDLR
jgi:hypothetical protein